MNLRARRNIRGFTLVELMVSLVAGVIIAMAVVTLARVATNTFYEEIRMGSVQSGVRLASERLRGDLLRAGFMSTSNIKYDPRVAGYVTGFSNPQSPNSRFASTDDLQSVMITVGGSTAAAKNGLTPDRIRVAGNLTSDDSYRGLWVDTGNCGGAGLTFNRKSDPATDRLVSAAVPLQAVKNVFTPDATKPFLVRVIDKHRCQHFAETCATNAVSMTADGFVLNLKGDVKSQAILRASASDSPMNCGAVPGESDLVVSPVHRVEWFLDDDSVLTTTTKTVVEKSGLGEETGGFKFNLYRRLLDANGAAVTTDIVAEYATDLKFGLVVHDPRFATPDNYKVLDMDLNGTDITAWTAAVSTETSQYQPGPQRIRSIRYRLGTRSAIADRDADLTVSTGAPYLSRYCMSTAVPCKTYARVRTLISEVALLNQERAFY